MQWRSHREEDLPELTSEQVEQRRKLHKYLRIQFIASVIALITAFIVSVYLYAIFPTTTGDISALALATAFAVLLPLHGSVIWWCNQNSSLLAFENEQKIDESNRIYTPAVVIFALISLGGFLFFAANFWIQQSGLYVGTHSMPFTTGGLLLQINLPTVTELLLGAWTIHTIYYFNYAVTHSEI